MIKRLLLHFCWAVLLAGFLFGGYALSTGAPGWLRTICIEIQAACRDAGTQWMVVFCLLSYLIVFVVLEAKSRVLGLGSKFGEQETERPTSNAQSAKPNDSGRESKVEGREREGLSLSSNFHPPSSSRPRAISSPDFWLIGFVGLVLFRYALDYTNAAKSLQVVVLLTGMVVGKGIGLYGAKVWRLGSGVSVSEPHKPITQTQDAKSKTLLFVMVLLLACAALWHPERGMEFQYRGQPRWTGPWDNPNLFGVLMGVGVILAVGLLVSDFRFQVSGPKPEPSNLQSSTLPASHWSRAYRFLFSGFLFSAFVLCAYGLVKSYSRGAWLGTAVGLAWLIGSWVWRLGSGGGLPKLAIGNQKSEMASFRRCWLPSSILLLSILVIAFWQFRHTESPLARRVFSVGNPNDFSWRNRVAAWEGAGRMMLARPLIGFGWGKAEEVYSKEYRAARLEESAAIQMNDYLMIGISVGAPALVCLLAYLGLALGRSRVGLGSPLPASGGASVPASRLVGSLTPPEGSGAHGVTRPTIHLQVATIAASGAIVLGIGFWFDGGLFKLPTGVVFWVLVELARGSRRGDEAVAALASDEQNGRAALLRRLVEQQLGPTELQSASVCASRLVSSLAPPIQCGAQRTARPTIALRWLAGIAALGALGLTTLHLGTPQFAVSERTLSIARTFLVPPQEKADFEFLAAKPIWSNTPLKTLLQHAHLANYNRTLVNWKLDEPMYREFVLSPEIAGANSLSSPKGGEGGGEEAQLSQVQNPSPQPSPRLGGARENGLGSVPHVTVNHQLSTDSGWRRPLWEHFYPRIRKESNLEAAAEIVVRHLNEICSRQGNETNNPLTRPPATLSPSDGERGSTPYVVAYTSVLEIWRRREATDAEFARVCVAVLRAVGIPARLATSGRAEFWNGTEWKPQSSARETFSHELLRFWAGAAQTFSSQRDSGAGGAGPRTQLARRIHRELLVATNA